jgi:hypothetical protein
VKSQELQCIRDSQSDTRSVVSLRIDVLWHVRTTTLQQIKMFLQAEEVGGRFPPVSHFNRLE